MRRRRQRTLAQRYELLEEVGAGGTGTVHRARDLRSREIVAVKLLHASLTSNPAFAQRFRREASIARDIASPHIARVIDFGSDDGTPFIVMEFVEGMMLQQLLAEHGPLPPEQALSIMAQVAAALRDAHAKGIVHRDIKPSNIKLMRDGSVKVLDFGIAKVEDGATITLAGAVFGSVHYMAPEQTKGREDARSDIYSLGVVAYQLLTGRVPFEAESPWAIVRMHLEADPPSLAEARPDVPASVATVVARCLQKLPEERYQSAQELLTALDNTGIGASLVRVRPRIGRRLKRLTPKAVVQRLSLVSRAFLAAIVLAAIIAGLVWFMHGAGGQGRAADIRNRETNITSSTATSAQTSDGSAPRADLIAAESARLAAAGTPVCPPRKIYYVPTTPGDLDARLEAPTQLTGSLDGKTKLWAVIVCPSARTTSVSSQRFIIYEDDGDALATLYFYDFGYIDFALPKFTDINGDGLKEIVLDESDSNYCGQCGAHGLRILQVQDHVASDLPIQLPTMAYLHEIHDAVDDGIRTAGPARLVDLNHDGVLELIAADYTWQLDPSCPTCSPESTFVLTWDGQSYTDASRDFVSYFDKQIADLEAKLLGPDLADWERINLAVAVALDYAHIGRYDTAWARFSEIVRSVSTPCWQQSLPVIEHDLELSIPRSAQSPIVSAKATPLPNCQ